MKKIIVCFIVVTMLSGCTLAMAMGMRVQDYINDYNDKFEVTWSSCLETSKDMYNLLNQNFQKAELQWLRIKTGVKDPITRLDGHSIVTYKEGSSRRVITTKTDDGINFYVADLNVGAKTLHEVCSIFEPQYKVVFFYRKGFGWLPKSRSLVMAESGHSTKNIDDVWQRVGKNEVDASKRNR